MAEDIKQFNPGDKLTADETNANNLLLKQWALDNSASEAYINTKMAQLSSELGAQITSINTQISSINGQISSLDNFQYMQKSLSIGIGKTSLTSYLPNDGKTYLVWLVGYMFDNQGDREYSETVATDVMKSANTYICTDQDGSRYSKARTLTVVPVGAGRFITIAKNGTPHSASRYLRGYCRI